MMSLIKIVIALVLGIYIANNNPELADQIYNGAMNFFDEVILFIKSFQQ